MRISRFFDTRFIMSGHVGKNLTIDMGPSVVLQHGNIFIRVTSRTGPHFAPEFFQAGGFDPYSAGLLVAKSPCGFRAAYESRAKKILMVRGHGCAPPDFWNYKYERAPHPLWPWEQIENVAAGQLMELRSDAIKPVGGLAR